MKGLGLQCPEASGSTDTESLLLSLACVSMGPGHALTKAGRSSEAKYCGSGLPGFSGFPGLSVSSLNIAQVCFKRIPG